MTDKQLILDALKKIGAAIAQSLQEQSPDMTGTQLYSEENYFPSFSAAIEHKNMLQRPIGFTCRSEQGHVVRLIQPYDSDIYPEQPEELPAHWGFVWSTDPAKARPFISVSTSPYNTGDCCTYNGRVWSSGQDGNVWAPGTVGVEWNDVGEVET